MEKKKRWEEKDIREAGAFGVRGKAKGSLGTGCHMLERVKVQTR